jgi:hypothetical protein
MGKHTSKAKIGRPPLGDQAMLAPIPVRLPVELRRELDALIAARKDKPKVAALIRELVAEAIEIRHEKAKVRR